MPFTSHVDKRYSDLVLHEAGEYIPREVRTIDVGTSAATLLQGTIVFRPIDIDPTVPYEVLTAPADISADNEYAFVIGDGYDSKEIIEFASGENDAILLVRSVRLKEARVQEVNDVLFAAASDAQWGSLKLLLSNQTILVEPSLEQYPSAF